MVLRGAEPDIALGLGEAASRVVKSTELSPAVNYGFPSYGGRGAEKRRYRGIHWTRHALDPKYAAADRRGY